MEIIFKEERPPFFSSFAMSLEDFLRKKKHEPILLFYRFFDQELLNKFSSYRIVLIYPPPIEKEIFHVNAIIVESKDQYLSINFPITNLRIVKPQLMETVFSIILFENSRIPSICSEKGEYYLIDGEFYSKKVEGWDYASRFLKSYSSPNTKIILDSFIENTFIFSSVSMRENTFIPYRNPWIGIAHHTFTGKYSANEMFNEYFTKSLDSCLGIVCLSEYLANEYRRRLKIPITVIPHPLINFKPMWKSYENIIVTVGEWYRNPFSLSLLNTSATKIWLRKYSIPFRVSFNTQNSWIRGALSYLIETHYPLGSFSDFELTKVQNNFPEKGIYSTLKRYLKKIKILDFLPEDEYYQLLTNSCVFLHLVDCSASFLIMQCIASNIPLLVNKHPAIVEYLGENYPLYYDNVEDIQEIDPEKINKASVYLSQLDKNRFSIEYFIHQIRTLIKNVSR